MSSFNRADYEEIFNRCKRIEALALKVWRAKHYKWANDINWEIQLIKSKIQEAIGQLE